MTQIAVLQTPEEIEHEKRREDLYAALSSCMDATSRMKRVAEGWPDKWARPTLRVIVDDLERQERRITRTIRKCEGREYS
jgi:hypothetical protein